MIKFNISQSINVDKKAVWNALSDIGNVADFHPMVQRSFVVGGKKTGLGAQRACEFYKNKGRVLEEITRYNEGSSFSIAIVEGTMPMSFGEATFITKAIDNKTTKVDIEIKFKMKGSFLGALMGKIMVKPMMKKTMFKLLESLEVHLTTGDKIGLDGERIKA